MNQLTWHSPDRAGGKLCYYGTRIPVATILMLMIDHDYSNEEIISDYPSLTMDHIWATWILYNHALLFD
jgi:uncharacterized protein (DUF433 family)